MTDDEKFNLITEGLEEVLTEQDLKKLLAKKAPLKHYIGFEISGKIHLGTGVATSLVIKNLQKAGVDCTIFLADWHTFINEKLGGADFETIQRVAVGYFKEGFAAALRCVGGNPKKVKFVLGRDFYNKEKNKYWEYVIRIAREVTLSRAKRSVDIMGRVAGEAMPVATLFYPMMQVADIFVQGINLAHGGMDQRKAHVIMRDVAPKIGGDLVKKKWVALHNHLILGLGKPPVWPVPKEKLRDVWTVMKMSKSKPESAVFIHDSPEEINAKIKKAFCPPGEIEFNPILDWTKHLTFPIRNELAVSRKKEHGGNVVYKNYRDLEKDYRDGKLHPEDLKNAVAKSLIDILMPARKYFQNGKPKKMLEELEKLV